MGIWSWLCSATSLLMIWKMGDRSIWGPILGLCSQTVWTAYVLTEQQYGLIPCVAGFWVVHCRNLYKWTRKEKQ